MAVVLARVVILPSCELTNRRHVVACRCCVLSGRWLSLAVPGTGAVGSFQHVNVNNTSIMSNLMIRTAPARLFQLFTCACSLHSSAQHSLRNAWHPSQLSYSQPSVQ